MMMNVWPDVFIFLIYESADLNFVETKQEQKWRLKPVLTVSKMKEKLTKNDSRLTFVDEIFK